MSMQIKCRNVGIFVEVKFRLGSVQYDLNLFSQKELVSLLRDIEAMADEVREHIESPSDSAGKEGVE